MAPTEGVAKPTFEVWDGNVRVTLEPGYYLDMTPTMADAFARKLLVEAARARGESGHLFVLGVGG